MMIRFVTRIQREGKLAEKLGWSFILIGAKLSEKLNPGVRRAFRVKGKLDNHPIVRTSLLPVRGGKFLLPINAAMRKGTGKKVGDTLTVEIEVDARPLPASTEFVACLKDVPEAYGFFKSLNTTNKNYFHTWINGAKTIGTKTNRIMKALEALQKKQTFVGMVREQHARRKTSEHGR